MIIGMVLKMKVGKYYHHMKYKCKYKGNALERSFKALEHMDTSNLTIECS